MFVMDNSDKDNVKWFRNAAPYINAHRGKTFVLMFGGEAVLHPNFANIIHDIALYPVRYLPYLRTDISAPALFTNDSNLCSPGVAGGHKEDTGRLGGRGMEGCR